MSIDRNAHVRDYLANERTYLAFVRTALSLISLGISVNRFSLYLIEKNVISMATTTGQTLRSTETLGAGMVVVGLLVMIWGTVHFGLTYRGIEQQTYRGGQAHVWILSGIILIASLLGAALLFVR
jgi:putative membrane protein